MKFFYKDTVRVREERKTIRSVYTVQCDNDNRVSNDSEIIKKVKIFMHYKNLIT